MIGWIEGFGGIPRTPGAGDERVTTGVGELLPLARTRVPLVAGGEGVVILDGGGFVNLSRHPGCRTERLDHKLICVCKNIPG